MTNAFRPAKLLRIYEKKSILQNNQTPISGHPKGGVFLKNDQKYMSNPWDLKTAMLEEIKKQGGWVN